MQSHTAGMKSTCCSNCGVDFHQHADAKRRIAELESQVRILSDKASAAVDKLADYEDEIRLLRQPKKHSVSSTVGSEPTSSPPLSRPPSGPSSSHMSVPPPALNRISAFLTAATKRAGAPPPSPPPEDGNGPLEQERRLRIKAEARLQEVTGELEDLSASLFQQANEMVASERRERAKLEERVAVLEGREGRVKDRLGLLERAVERIGRVREVLSEPPRASMGGRSLMGPGR
ncbi:hypothetical protein Q9L58_005687 [Maublancomyces gigas]|uniref:GDP/GTP exchange factor Sec2 N-terminal domain-containing protein n=1 Tax=Discina gigas TaxID=1032678 RepID=A0ABR3GHH3_9PEZI